MAAHWRHRGGTLPLGRRTHLFGVVNVTPDSFSDGGRYPTEGTAVAHGLQLLADGASVLDVGGESTRPGATPVASDEEARRVVPVVRRLAAAGAIVSVDTSKADVAEAALEAGAHAINDVTSGRDPAMFGTVARHGAGLVLMHMKGDPATMQGQASYADVVKEVASHLVERAKAAEAAGVPRDAIMLDPGLGFGKTGEHNVEILRRLGEVRALGRPVLVGASRKSFLGSLTAGLDGRVPSPQDRMEASLAAHVVAAARGADAVRVHDVRAHSRAFAVADAILRSGA